MEDWSMHLLSEKAEVQLGSEIASDLQKYAIRLSNNNLPVIFTLKHLCKITGVDYNFLHSTVDRKREHENYSMFAVKKRSGGRRFIHAVSEKLIFVQRFINLSILQQTQQHPCSYAFHSKGGIKRCAAMHCGAKWLFQFDLSDFFYDVTEIDVYLIFKRLGYKNLLAFELARICTTTHLPTYIKKRLLFLKKTSKYYQAYKRTEYAGVLPQGAPSSPILSNLATEKLDKQLYDFSINNGFVYTRYADDLTFSSIKLPHKTSIAKIHKQIIRIIRLNKFMENKEKIRIAGPGSKKIVLGLLVDSAQPRISKEMYKRIDRHLYASKKFGLKETAIHENFDSVYGFYNHLSGLISYVKDVDYKRWEEFKERFSEIQAAESTKPYL